MGTGSKPPGKAMYVASSSDWRWLRSEQRRLYARSWKDPDCVFRKLWGLVTDPRNLRVALGRVARNRGRRTGGVDGVTVRRVVAEGADAFLTLLRQELRAGTYQPAAARRVFIPKPGHPAKYRPLGIPTVRDRVVQAAVKNILEPIFEADFYPTSYGFRPGRHVHAALAQLLRVLRPRPTKAGQRRPAYQWAIEGDIRGCFDGIDHHGLMQRVRRRVADRKVNRLVLAFLRSGVLDRGQFTRTETGTPQGGILSPLLANIALAALDERYERQVWPRRSPTLLQEAGAVVRRAKSNRERQRDRGQVVFFPLRYADDFIVFVGAPPGPEQESQGRQAAQAEKAALAKMLDEELGLQLSEEKTAITQVTSALPFLGHHARVRMHPRKRRLFASTTIPKHRSQQLREEIKRHFRRQTCNASLADRLRALNLTLRGWANFYRHAWGASRVFSKLDHYVWWTVLRWLRKKHQKVSMRMIARRYGWRRSGRRSLFWRDGDVTLFRLGTVRVHRFYSTNLRPPDFAATSMESPVRIERRTPGSAGGVRKPPGASQARRRTPT